jgi:oligopeptidase B
MTAASRALLAAVMLPSLWPADATTQTTSPPGAAVRPHELTIHGDTRVDDYYWLRERESPEVIAYLEAENAYLESVMADTESLQAQLFDEIRGRIRQDDSTVPYRDGGWLYYTRYEDGHQYPIYARKRDLDGAEHVLLDVNTMAEGHAFYSVGGRQVTEDGRVLAYGVDTEGRRKYTVRFKDLTTGRSLDDVIPDVTANFVWANDGHTLFYVRQDPATLRAYQVFRHVLGTDHSADVLVYEEPDTEFMTFVQKTLSNRYLLIASFHTLSAEYRYLDASDPTGDFRIVVPREREHEYTVEGDVDGDFVLRTNDRAQNFKIVRAPVGDSGREHWREVVPHRADVFVEGAVVFQNHAIVTERSDGLLRMDVLPWDGSADHYIDFGEPAYRASPSVNAEFETATFRYGYTSLTTPFSVFAYDLGTRERTLLKQDEIGGGFRTEDYRTERRYAEARDGTAVPVSIVYRRDAPLEGRSPLLLYAYGSYGSSTDAAFNAPLISLLDRGFVYAIAHVRGGQELGRDWYEQGKLFNKRNTFTDFIDVAEFLVREGYANPEQVFARGGSAGGLLMGAVLNMRPDLWKGVVARVPFVDIVTTMLDESIPLTTFEYDEWGNPNERDDYEYMLSYSPYDNVRAVDYPAILVTTGLQDSQVQYWEPAKWVAKLRASDPDDELILLKTTMEAGHGGVSGRYRQYEDLALEFAFVLKVAGLAAPLS